MPIHLRLSDPGVGAAEGALSYRRGVRSKGSRDRGGGYDVEGFCGDEPDAADWSGPCRGLHTSHGE